MLCLSAFMAGGMFLMMGAGKGTSSLTLARPVASPTLLNKGAEAKLNREQSVNQGLGLLASQIIDLDLDLTPGVPVLVRVPIDGVERTIHLLPDSVRAASYTLRVHDDNGLHNVEPGISRTLAGTLVDEPGVTVAGSMMTDGLYASLAWPDGRQYYIEPVADITGDPGSYAVYDGEDVLDGGGTCGVAAGAVGEEFAAVTNDDPLVEVGSSFFCAELAADADFQFYSAHGSSVSATEARVELVIQLVNNIYQAQVGISHIITNITVRTSSGANPYTTNNAEALLGQVRSWWQANGGPIPRDVVHMFTGRNIDGTTIGIAYIGAICNFNIEYGLVQSDCCGSLACASNLSAHELGHNWNAGHCNCPSNIMNSGLTCVNNFSAGSISSITNYRNAIQGCLDQCNGTGLGPDNDNCASPIDVTNGSIAFTNVDATTDGPDNDCGGVTIESDVWFDYTADCNGTVTVSTCFSNFDTMIAVYAGQSCAVFAAPLACNDNSSSACGPGALQSSVTFDVIQGNHYQIRVGGGPAGPEQGANGSLSIDCVPFATGACCIGNNCFALSAMNCAASAGTYIGDGVPCSPNPCSAPTGACCLGASCISLTSADCATFGGTYNGNGSQCVPDPCAAPAGACCTDGVCSVGSEDDCATRGGTYQGDDTNCGSVECESFCPADITGPGDAPDGNVDSLDFLVLIGQWGTPCVGSCEADITGATAGVPDGNVDSLDFLYLISQWGSPATCP